MASKGDGDQRGSPEGHCGWSLLVRCSRVFDPIGVRRKLRWGREQRSARVQHACLPVVQLGQLPRQARVRTPWRTVAFLRTRGSLKWGSAFRLAPRTTASSNATAPAISSVSGELCFLPPQRQFPQFDVGRACGDKEAQGERRAEGLHGSPGDLRGVEFNHGHKLLSTTDYLRPSRKVAEAMLAKVAARSGAGPVRLRFARKASLTRRKRRNIPRLPRERGGIGRRTRFRFWRGNSREGSSPSVRTHNVLEDTALILKFFPELFPVTAPQKSTKCPPMRPFELPLSSAS